LNNNYYVLQQNEEEQKKIQATAAKLMAQIDALTADEKVFEAKMSAEDINHAVRTRLRVEVVMFDGTKHTPRKQAIVEGYWITLPKCESLGGDGRYYYYSVKFRAATVLSVKVGSLDNDGYGAADRN